jgi:hypothetical protein
MNTITFKPNEPQVLYIKEIAGVLDGFNVLYETSDGRTLQLPKPAAVKLNMLEPEPGEEFSATKFQTGREPAEWVFALTARSEQLRAQREAEALAEKTRADLPGQLAASLRGTRPVTEIPREPPGRATEPVQEPKGTGTYGPIPQVALAARKRFDPIPFNLAFREVVGFVTKELNASGEQWSEQSRQDLVSTVLIAASKAGWISPWERGEASQ